MTSSKKRPARVVTKSFSHPIKRRQRVVLGLSRSDLPIKMDWVYLGWFYNPPLGAERSTVAFLKYQLGDRGLILDCGDSGVQRWADIRVMSYGRSVYPTDNLWIESTTVQKAYVSTFLPDAVLSIRGLHPFIPVVKEANSVSTFVRAEDVKPLAESFEWVKSAKRVVTNSEYMQQVIAGVYGRQAEIIPTMVSRIVAPLGGKVLFADSRRWKHSGLMPRLVEALPDVEFRVVNRGGDIPKARNLEVVEPTENPSNIFFEVGLAICASQVPESYGRVAKEAVDSGRAVLVTPAGALVERVPPECVISADDFEEWVARVGGWASTKVIDSKMLFVVKEGLKLDPSVSEPLEIDLEDLALSGSQFDDISVAEDVCLRAHLDVLDNASTVLNADGSVVTLSRLKGFEEELLEVAALSAGFSLEEQGSNSRVFRKVSNSDLPVLMLRPKEFIGVAGSACGLRAVAKDNLREVAFRGDVRSLFSWKKVGFPAVILEGWKPEYETLIRQWADTVVAVHFHSSFGQSELGAPVELEFLSKLLDLSRSCSNMIILHPSREDARALRELGFRCYYLPNLVDFSRYSEVGHRAPFSVDLVVPMFPRKNIVAQLVACAVADVALVLHSVGTSRFTGLYKNIARTLGGRVEFSSLLPWGEYLRLLASSHLGLQASFTESYGYVAVDHFAVGTPCLVSQQVPSVVLPIMQDKDMVDRLVVSNDNGVEDMVRKIRWFQENGNEVGPIAARARALIRAQGKKDTVIVKAVISALAKGEEPCQSL